MGKKSWEYERILTLKGKEFKGDWPTITEYWNYSVKRFPKNIVFRSYKDNVDLHFTYHEADKLINKVSAFIAKNNIQAGDKIALSGPNSIEWAIIFLAITRIGAVVVPIDNSSIAKNFLNMLVFADCKALFIDDKKYRSLGTRPRQLEDLNFIFKLDEIISNFANEEAQGQTKQHNADCDDLAVILYTSGTTGNEKAVMLSHTNLLSDVLQAIHPDFLQMFPTDIFYLLLPMHHSYPLTAIFLVGICNGGQIVFPRSLAVQDIFLDLQKSKVTIFMGVPMLFNKILNGILSNLKKKSRVLFAVVSLLMKVSGFLKDTFKIKIGKKLFAFILKKVGFTNIRVMICGGGPLLDEILVKYNQLGLEFVQGYGMTEAAPIITYNSIKNFRKKSVGLVFPLIDLKILDADANGFGEIAIKGPNVTKGYYKNDKATAELYNRDGYMLTGDVGYLSDRYLFLTGRKKSLIVSTGGKNIFPEEIEDEFQLYASMEQVLIRGFLLSDKVSEGIEIVIFPNSEAFPEGTAKEKVYKEMLNIVLDVNKRLQPHQRIQQIRIMNEALPQTSTRKIKRSLVNDIINDSNSTLINSI